MGFYAGYWGPGNPFHARYYSGKLQTWNQNGLTGVGGELSKSKGRDVIWTSRGGGMESRRGTKRKKLKGDNKAAGLRLYLSYSLGLLS